MAAFVPQSSDDDNEEDYLIMDGLDLAIDDGPFDPDCFDEFLSDEHLKLDAPLLPQAFDTKPYHLPQSSLNELIASGRRAVPGISFPLGMQMAGENENRANTSRRIVTPSSSFRLRGNIPNPCLPQGFPNEADDRLAREARDLVEAIAAQQQQEQQQQHQAVDYSRLHKACCRKGRPQHQQGSVRFAPVTVEEIAEILRRDPVAAYRAVVVEAVKKVYSPMTQQLVSKSVKETYTYPINLAIQSGASPRILEYLINAAPSVLVEQDGPMKECSLAILLRYKPTDYATFENLMTFTRCACVLVRDRHENTALHIACRHATGSDASLKIVKALVGSFPKALGMRNFHGKTPMQVLSNKIATESISAFLWKEQSKRLL